MSRQLTEVEALRMELAAAVDIHRAEVLGLQAQLDDNTAHMARLRDEVTMERRLRHRALADMAEVQGHNGRLYRRIRQVGQVVEEFGASLPPEFVGRVRALTDPDFAELLGVQ